MGKMMAVAVVFELFITLVLWMLIKREDYIIKKARVLSLEGKKMCSKCKKIMDMSDIFCEKCGCQRSINVSTICHSCQTRLGDGARFCKKCGTKSTTSNGRQFYCYMLYITLIQQLGFFLIGSMAYGSFVPGFFVSFSISVLNVIAVLFMSIGRRFEKLLLYPKDIVFVVLTSFVIIIGFDIVGAGFNLRLAVYILCLAVFLVVKQAKHEK